MGLLSSPAQPRTVWAGEMESSFTTVAGSKQAVVLNLSESAFSALWVCACSSRRDDDDTEAASLRFCRQNITPECSRSQRSIP